MPASASTRKSITDLTRRRARAAFTVLTLAIAVASVGVFAVPSLLQDAMDREIAATRLADLTVTMEPTVLDAAALRAVARVPNVEAVQPKSIFSTRILVGQRRQKALVIGVPDFARQPVDRVAVASGTAPGRGTVLTEVQNARGSKFEGDAVRVLAGDSRLHTLDVRGEGRYLGGGSLVASDGFAVFYATPDTVADLRGEPGTTMLALRLRDPSRASAERTAAAVRDELRSVPGFTGFADYPEVREDGDYPGKDLFADVATLMTLITVLALLSALMLLANTMTTLIGEQTGEIAAMKAIGATRRQVARIYRRTALLLGVLGALVGSVLGVVLANLVTGFFATEFYGVDAGFHVTTGIVAASLLVALVGPPLAAIPAIRRASRLPLREALSASGSALGGQGRLDRALRHVVLLPRSAQIGLRGVGRRKRRTLATTAQVALAVGTLLSLLSLGTSVGNMTHAFFDDARWDLWATTYASRPLDVTDQRAIAATPGVAEMQPLLTNAAQVGGDPAFVWGLPDDPMYRPKLSSGRWYTAAERRDRRPVAVIGRALAQRDGVGLGEVVRIATSSGPVRLRVVGLTTNEVFQGGVAFVPLATLQDVLDTPGRVNAAWIRATSDDHAVIDRLTTRVEDLLGARGNQVTTDVAYVSERDAAAGNASLTTSITVLGLLIVAISLIGLVNAITMGVIERTREIGMLRCVGARARDVRRIFATEGLVVAGLGWAVGVPLGLLMAHGLTSATASIASVDLEVAFPVSHLLVTLVGTVVLALLVLLAPLRRAVRLRPGDALRYG